MSRFSQTLREHAAYPSNRGRLPSSNAVGRASVSNNPPFVVVYLRIEDDLVKECGFESEGCGVTAAICSALTEIVVGKSVSQCQEVTPQDVALALDGIPADKMHCAHIVLKALNKAIDEFLGIQS